jgi:hypothetical protein
MPGRVTLLVTRRVATLLFLAVACSLLPSQPLLTTGVRRSQFYRFDYDKTHLQRVTFRDCSSAVFCHDTCYTSPALPRSSIYKAIHTKVAESCNVRFSFCCAHMKAAYEADGKGRAKGCPENQCKNFLVGNHIIRSFLRVLNQSVVLFINCVCN